MVFFNYALRKLNAKIVYYGPGLCGKTTNLQWIHDHFEGGQRGKMISLATEGDRTIFFDLLPIDIGTIRGMDVTLQLYTVPGQVHYNSTRQLVLRGADGVVFVADSQRTMRSSNIESYENLQENLMLQGIDLKDFPHALQFNKRDLRDLLSTEDLNESLNLFSVPIFEAVATEGIGVQETLEGIVKLVMRNLREKYEPVASASGPQAPAPMQVTGPTGFNPPQRPAAPGASGPMAPDFVDQKGPPSIDREVGVHSAAFKPGAAATQAPDETQAVGPDSGFAAFQNEDGISTAVYEDENEETAVHVPAHADQEAGDEDAAFGPDVDTAADSFEPEEPKEPEAFGGIFAGFTGEDEAGEADESPFEPAAASDEPAKDPVEDVAAVAEAPQPEMPKESMEDLFEADVPSVKSFVKDAMDDAGISVESSSGADHEPMPPTVDAEQMATASAVEDRFEDRIEAPGPFAPPSSDRDEPEEAAEVEAEVDQEAVHAEVRQALGASEDREALASLSASVEEKIEDVIEVEEAPDEVQPVIPPAPEEPAAVEAPIADRDDPSPAFVIDAPEATEPAASEPNFEVSSPGEAVFGEPAVDEPVIEAPVVEEPVAEPILQEPVVEEPTVEPVVEEPVVEPVMESVVVEPPAPADDPLAKSQPIMVGSGDPFAAGDDEFPPDVITPGAPIVPSTNAIDVTAEDNQLHLQLKGSGAIAEMGQVRALDIEVPVPGQWVGNRKVTLQLRLTLTPAENQDD